ncbi:hypothetical protein AHiyo1_10500 [Arthrobacter sp. Hiyo1]|nr:hypothetical protein AHiyo1_10500 [Arthrobacter sp. Hiyo1]
MTKPDFRRVVRRLGWRRGTWGGGIAVVVRAALETPVDTKLSAGAVH